MTENEEAYALGFSEGLSYGIDLMMEELKKISDDTKVPTSARVFLRGFVDNYKKDAANIAAKTFEAINAHKVEKTTCH
ncbi:hypothetical protein [uncultured Desulfovibrio sp.]|uniref:hypothetical protein n=1 Tax=uncultured Desulfovibrio sp. TaxID=167968 RepID=UPI0026026270|nr:hypothetical protein [uncultured Desulfovibrio sp.]